MELIKTFGDIECKVSCLSLSGHYLSVLGLSQPCPQTHVVILGLLSLCSWPRLLVLLHFPLWGKDKALALPGWDQVVCDKNNCFSRVRKLAAERKPS